MMKKNVQWFLILPGVLILIIGIGWFSYPRIVEKILENQIRKNQRHGFYVEKITFSPWENRIVLHNFAWKNPKQKQFDISTILIRTLHADLQVTDLLHRVIHIKNLSTHSVHVSLAYNSPDAAVPNHAAQKQTAQPAKSSRTPEKPVQSVEKKQGRGMRPALKSGEKPASPWHIRIDHLQIENTRAVLAANKSIADLILDVLKNLTERYKDRVPGFMRDPKWQKQTALFLARTIQVSFEKELREGLPIPDCQIRDLGKEEQSSLPELSDEFCEKYLEIIQRQLHIWEDRKKEEVKAKLQKLADSFIR